VPEIVLALQQRRIKEPNPCHRVQGFEISGLRVEGLGFPRGDEGLGPEAGYAVRRSKSITFQEVGGAWRREEDTCHEAGSHLRRIDFRITHL
jgi:hypothetical protein